MIEHRWYCVSREGLATLCKDRADEHGVKWSGAEADRYTMEKHGDRPMCCGVLL
jgi:hypothetical protein